ncbi:MAG: fibronectin type III domain-containing protein, partial [Nocardioidaceae bacterium]
LVICFQQARFVDQIAVTPDSFSAGGDSGSLIVTQGGNEPVALLFAGGDGRTIGTPIDTVLQRFGVTVDGSTPPLSAPGAPTGLTALAGNASASLSWQAPTFDGGSAVTGYTIYRGTSPGAQAFLANVGPVTSFDDSGLTNGTTYYYKVSASNAIGEGPLSGEASATPSDLVLPVEPLPTLDDFNRPDENPLSDAGKWSNGILGSAETGLHTLSAALACTKTTTCSGWRSNLTYGPDVESWARISALPGAGNAVRLYARLQTPGSSAVDGYMLVYFQLSGTDQVVLYRITNGAVTVLVTVNQEVALGDRLLLRATGSTLEAWRHDGVAWSRLGTVSDSTYAAAGYLGVGVRGTSGRLDDFGGRTLGAQPPDLE